MRFWRALAAYVVVDVLATWATVRWLESSDRKFLILALACYVGCSAAWLWGIADADPAGLARAFATYPVVALSVGVLASRAFSGESLSGRAWAGVGFGMVSVALLALEESKK